jgi:mRNA-degrading endonuclease toxin of MazEF toxin-antitoxin module
LPPKAIDVYRRGAVWIAQLPDIGRKPAVILSDQTVTFALRPTVARITSVERARALPTTVVLEPGEVDGLPERSYVLCHDLLTVPIEELVTHLGAAPSERMSEIEDRLAFVFGVGDWS